MTKHIEELSELIFINNGNVELNTLINNWIINQTATTPRPGMVKQLCFSTLEYGGIGSLIILTSNCEAAIATLIDETFYIDIERYEIHAKVCHLLRLLASLGVVEHQRPTLLLDSVFSPTPKSYNTIITAKALIETRFDYNEHFRYSWVERVVNYMIYQDYISFVFGDEMYGPRLVSDKYFLDRMLKLGVVVTNINFLTHVITYVDDLSEIHELTIDTVKMVLLKSITHCHTCNESIITSLKKIHHVTNSKVTPAEITVLRQPVYLKRLLNEIELDHKEVFRYFMFFNDITPKQFETIVAINLVNPETLAFVIEDSKTRFSKNSAQFLLMYSQDLLLDLDFHQNKLLLLKLHDSGGLNNSWFHIPASNNMNKKERLTMLMEYWKLMNYTNTDNLEDIEKVIKRTIKNDIKVNDKSLIEFIVDEILQV